ncbi:hypothetical protein IPN35_06440 [Candidatus Peregrinibacteria bacterium]|nr:MAG: hypothetical protein IPN35_06440 [Candidatus Peregrinibacteria bacterium]
MVLEVNVRLRDQDGARWMHNEVPKDKGVSFTFPEFCGDGPGCDILSPRKYRPQIDNGKYRIENNKIVGQENVREAGDDGKIGTKDDVYIIPQEGYFRFAIPKDKLNSLEVIEVNLTDKSKNYVSFEGGDDTTDNTILKRLYIDKDQKANVGAIQAELSFFVTKDEKASRLLIGSIPVGGVSVYDQFITNVGQFFRRSAAMLGWTLEITNEGYKNSKIEGIALVIRNIVNGLIILSIMGIAALWIFSALIPAQVVRRSTTLILISAIVVNFAMPMMRLVLDGASIIQRTFLNREMTDDRFLRIENISDVWVGTGAMVLQPRTMKEGNENVDDFVDLGDRYVDMRQESTYFHGFLLIALALGEILVAIILALRIVILWFFLILSPLLAVLPIFHFTRGVFRYWIWLFGRWLFLGPLIAMCLFIAISIWQHTGIPIESSFEGFAGTSFLSNTTNIQMYAPGVVHGEGGNMGSATELMKFIIGILMVWFSVIVPFWLTRSKILSSCCGGNREQNKLEVPKKSFFPPLLPQKSEPQTPPSGGEKPALAIRTGSHFDLKFPEKISSGPAPTFLSQKDGKAHFGKDLFLSEKTGEMPTGISVSAPNANIHLEISEKELSSLGQGISASQSSASAYSNTNTTTTSEVSLPASVQEMKTQEIIDRLEHSPASIFASVSEGADQESVVLHSELENRATMGDQGATSYLKEKDVSSVASTAEKTEANEQVAQSVSSGEVTGEAIRMEDLQSEKMASASLSNTSEPVSDIEESSLSSISTSQAQSTKIPSQEEEFAETSATESTAAMGSSEAYTVEGMEDFEPVEEAEYVERGHTNASAHSEMEMEMKEETAGTGSNQKMEEYSEESSSHALSSSNSQSPVETEHQESTEAEFSAQERTSATESTAVMGSSEAYTVEGMEDFEPVEEAEYVERGHTNASAHSESMEEYPVGSSEAYTVEGIGDFEPVEEAEYVERGHTNASAHSESMEEYPVGSSEAYTVEGIGDFEPVERENASSSSESRSTPSIAAQGEDSEVAREFAMLNAKSSEIQRMEFEDDDSLSSSALSEKTKVTASDTEEEISSESNSSHEISVEEDSPESPREFTNLNTHPSEILDLESEETNTSDSPVENSVATNNNSITESNITFLEENDSPEVAATGDTPETAREMAKEEKKIVKKSENVRLKKTGKQQDDAEKSVNIEEEVKSEQGDQKEKQEEFDEESLPEDEEVKTPKLQEQEMAQEILDDEETPSTLEEDKSHQKF